MFNYELLLFVTLILLSACTKNMAIQPKFQAEGETTFFADGRMMRPPVKGTIAIDDPDPKATLETGDDLSKFPLPLTAKFLKTGQVRYNIYCTPCHDRTGEGNGIVVQRGYQKPRSFSYLGSQTDGTLFHTITFGKGNMVGYRNFLPRDERWAIVAYLRVLYLSQNFPASALEPADLAKLQKGVNH